MGIIGKIFRKSVWIAEIVTIKDGEIYPGAVICTAKTREAACEELYQNGFAGPKNVDMIGDLGVRKGQYSLHQNIDGEYARIRLAPVI